MKHNLPEISNESKFSINSITEFDEKHSSYAKLKGYSYCLTYELYEFVKKLTEFGYRIYAKFWLDVKFGRITEIK